MTASQQLKYRRLDLGAGTVRRVDNSVRADLVAASQPDVIVDASRILPFRTDTFENVYCFDLVEHIDDLTVFMSEVHRILVPDGALFLTTPHFSSANSFTDPTHKHHLGWRSFDYFTPGHALSYYSGARFRITNRVLRFHGGLVNAAARRFAARWPDLYERRFAWMVPAWYMEVSLVALK
jgi:SAM-dependent methyltransferase